MRLLELVPPEYTLWHTYVCYHRGISRFEAPYQQGIRGSTKVQTCRITYNERDEFFVIDLGVH